MKEFKYVVTDAEGIHARPAGLLVKKAGEFTSSVTIAKGDKSADAKRIFADGADEDAAIAELEAFFKENL